MTGIKLQANTTGIGTVTIAAPNTNTDRTVTIPDVSGNVVVSDGSLVTASYGASTLSFGGTVDMTGATVKGIGAWTIQNSNNATLTAGQNLFANTRAGALTLNLPASATIGSTIRVIDNEGLCSSNNITINRNGHNIDGSARNVVLNVDRQGVQLVYVSGDTGWATVKKQRESQKTGSQGEISGYASGGDEPTKITNIEKFSFASDENSTNIAVLTEARAFASGSSSNENGYTVGGNSAAGPRVTTIDKFPFASDSNATDVGDSTVTRSEHTGQQSLTHGYSSGGYGPSDNNVIEKFPFATDTNASDVGDLTQARYGVSGASSDVFGYTQGGWSSPAPGPQNTIDKFPFASDANATDVGDLGANRYATAGNSSAVRGYASGGRAPPGGTFTEIFRFDFASDTNSTSGGATLTQARESVGSQSSTVSGYVTGGISQPATTRYNTIDKFLFATDEDATDVGDVTSARRGNAGQQV